MLRLGSSEWQATQARYMRSTRAALPGSAIARPAVSKSSAIARGWTRFIVDLHRFLGCHSLLQKMIEHACRPQPNAFGASFPLTRDVTSSGRCQIRGGRKGGLPVCEANGLAANGIVMLAKGERNTMIDDAAAAKLQHFSAQVAMAAQSSMAFAHGSAIWGQQSGMSSIADMPAAGAGDLTPAPPAAGSIATARAIRSARMVRPLLMARAAMKIAGTSVPRSRHECAR